MLGAKVIIYFELQRFLPIKVDYFSSPAAAAITPPAFLHQQSSIPRRLNGGRKMKRGGMSGRSWGWGFEGDVGLVFYQVKPLVAVVPETGVAGKECDMLGDGMCYDDVVAGVAMILLFV